MFSTLLLGWNSIPGLGRVEGRFHLVLSRIRSRSIPLEQPKP